MNSHQTYFRFYHWYVPIATVNALGCMLFSCQTRFMRQGVLRKLLRVMAFAIPYCFDSVPLLYRSVSFTASTVCPYCTGQYPLLLRQCALTV